MKTSWQSPLRYIGIGLFIILGISPICLAEVIKVEGTTGQGTQYVFYVPENWNGTVVYYAHGVTDPASAPSLPAELEGMKGIFLDKGYAVAASSYSISGFAVKEGIEQTHQLSDLFTSKFGKPKRSYIVGQSMGGLIAVGLVEKFGTQYDGALPMCGVVGGSKMTTDYTNNTRVLFDYFYPDVLPGSAMEIPDSLKWYDVPGPVVSAVLSNPAKAILMAGTDQLGIVYNDFGELLNSIVLQLLIHAMVMPQTFDLTHHHVNFDNINTYYTNPLLTTAQLADLNTHVDRFAATPDARNFYDHWYEPTGKLKIPVLTLHNTRDPIAPIGLEDAFEQIVNSTGSESLLARKVVNVFGHCAFTNNQIKTAFEELVSWVEGGPKPPDGVIP
jgi:pimeloyl-ACP methyl ester carboxylesterase